MPHPVVWLAVTLLLVAACGRTPPPRTLPDVAVDDPAFAATVQAHTAAPVSADNRVELLLNGDQIFPAKLAAIRSARASITYAEYFYAEGPIAAEIAQALAERCRAGVQARVLVDGVGALSMKREHRRTIEDGGCRLATFRPIGPLALRRNNHRNHRRGLVVDGRLGITGGSGVSWKWMGDGRAREHWRDTDVRLEGPAVAELQAAFLENWREATGEMLGGPAFLPPARRVDGGVTAQVVRSSWADDGQPMASLFLLAIAGARRSIHVTNPYFVPDRPLSTPRLTES